jgi:hypothetical protein
MLIPTPTLQIFLACVISGIALIFHSFYRTVVLTSWDRSMSGCQWIHLPLRAGAALSSRGQLDCSNQPSKRQNDK